LTVFVIAYIVLKSWFWEIFVIFWEFFVICLHLIKIIIKFDVMKKLIFSKIQK